jgi:hypothetical protein
VFAATRRIDAHVAALKEAFPHGTTGAAAAMGAGLLCSLCTVSSACFLLYGV